MAETTGRIGLYSDGDTVGGAERSMFNLIGAYEGSYELVIVSPSPAVIDEAERLVPDVPRHLLRSTSGLVDGVRAHHALFRALDLSLLQVTLNNPFTARPALLAGSISRIPTVAVEQLVLPSTRRRGAVLKRFRSRFLAAHIAVGDSSADELHRFFGIPRRRIQVVHNGVSVDGVRRMDLGAGPIIGCAARLEDQKQLDVLIDAFAVLGTGRLVMVGDGSRKDELVAQAERLGVADRITWVGWVDDARPYVAGFDIFALSSRAESFPLSIVEAMLLGVPVVATDVGSVSDAVVDGETGRLVASGDREGLAHALRQLCDDEGLRSRLAEAGRRRATERFTDVAMAQSYARIWSDVLGR